MAATTKPVALPIFTAVSILELAEEAYLMQREMAEAEGGSESWYNEALFVETIVNATWVPRLIGHDEERRIEAAWDKADPKRHRNFHSGEITLVTTGIRDNLKDTITSERSVSASTDPRFPTVRSWDVFQQMIDEGVVDWDVRKSAVLEYEIRVCAFCSKPFEPQLRSRGRFSSNKCRKDFNNLRAGTHSWARFKCSHCSHEQSMESFSGLYELAGPRPEPVTAARMTGYLDGSVRQSFLCVQCVRNEFPEWNATLHRSKR